MRGILCRLLPLSDDSLGQLAKWFSAEVCEALLRGNSSMIVREFGRAAFEAEGRRAALVADSRGTIVGLVHWWNLGEGVYEVGGATGDQRSWNTGIGMEAAMLLVDYLFEVLNCRRVEFTTGLHNDAILNVGMSDEIRFEAVCGDYFETSEGVFPAVKSGLTRYEYYQPYPHYQPRVGRRLDEDEARENMRALSQRIDVHDIANRVGADD